MPRIGELGENPLVRVHSELGYLAASIVVRYIEREFIWPVPRPNFLPVLVQFGAKFVGMYCFYFSSIFLVLDAIDSPYARGFR